jgi:hypothetical protein
MTSYDNIDVNASVLKKIMSLSNDSLLTLSTKDFIPQQQRPKITIESLKRELELQLEDFMRIYNAELQLHYTNKIMYELTIDFYNDVMIPEFKQRQDNLVKSVEIIN